MKKLLFLLLLSFNAYAVERTIIWTPPTQRADNTTLLSSEIAGYKLICWKGAERCGTTSIGNVSAHTIDMPVGVYTFYMRTIDTDGRESDLSNSLTINFTQVKTKPLPPSNLSE